MFDCVICGNEHLDVDESCERAAYRRRLIMTDQSRIAENEKRRAEGAREEREAVVRLISEDPRLQGWRLEPVVEAYRRLLLDLLHAGEHRK